MTYDLVIRGGLVVDGTGASPYQGDVALKDGRIAAVGKVEDTAAARVIEADGLAVAPGFVDIHTHYDAQVLWDPLLSSSSEHGVTTVVTGNCGIGVAPCRPEDHEITMRDLVSLEAIPYEVLEAGLDWKWKSFPDYLKRIENAGVGINLAPIAPLATLRRYVMGEAATERAATEEEAKGVAAELREAMLAGAIGFSTTTVLRQKGYRGQALACTHADRAELGAYARVLGELGTGVIQGNVTDQLSSLSDAEYDLLDYLMTESGRPVSWSGALHRSDMPDEVYAMLDKAAPLLARGGRPQSTIRTLTTNFTFKRPMMMSDCPTIAKRALNRTKEELRQVYADPEFRAGLRADLEKGDKVYSPIWQDMVVHEVTAPALRPYFNRTVKDVAAERGADPFDTLLDLFLEDDLELIYIGGVRNTDKKALKSHIAEPRLLIGMGDGGAHVDMLFECSYPTYMLGHWVREEQAMTLERAVQRMTTEPAAVFGLHDRGLLSPGLRGDVAIFDPATVGCPEKANEVRHDLPAGGMRLYAAGQGVKYVVVNGEVLLEEGRHTGALPGEVGYRAA